MPLVYQHNINGTTKLGVWSIQEDENFFLEKVPNHKGISHWHKRLQHLAGRYLLQELYPQFPYGLIQIAETRRPFLPDEEYHFSISHCGDYAAAIVSTGKRVGVDIELCNPRVMKVKNKFLHPDELKFSNDHLEKLTLMWSAKEALFKWYALGGVDFKEHLRLHKFELEEQGSVEAIILKDDPVSLKVKYIITEQYVLAWTASEETKTTEAPGREGQP